MQVLGFYSEQRKLLKDRVDFLQHHERPITLEALNVRCQASARVPSQSYGGIATLEPVFYITKSAC